MPIRLIRDAGSVTRSGGSFDGGTITVAEEIPAGSFVALSIAGRADGSFPNTVTVTDSAGNTWTTWHGMLQDSMTTGGDSGSTTYGDPILGLWWTVLTRPILAGGTIVVSVSGGAIFSHFVMTATVYSGLTTTIETSNYTIYGTLSSSGTTAPTVTVSPPAPSPPDTVGRALIIGQTSPMGPTSDTFTQDTDTVGGRAWFSTERVGTSGLTLNNAYKILDGQGNQPSSQTWNPTLGTARNTVISLHVFRPIRDRRLFTPRRGRR